MQYPEVGVEGKLTGLVGGGGTWAESTVLPHPELPNNRNIKKGGIMWMDQTPVISVILHKIRI